MRFLRPIFLLLLVLSGMFIQPLQAANTITLLSNKAGYNTWATTHTFEKISDTYFSLVIDAREFSHDLYFRLNVDGTQWGPYNTYSSQSDYLFPSNESSYYASTSYYSKSFGLSRSVWDYDYYLITAVQATDGWYTGRWNISVYGINEEYEVDVNSSPLTTVDDMTYADTYYGYATIAAAVAKSPLNTVLKSINSQLDTSEGLGWKLVKKLTINGTLNFADVCVLHRMANHNCLFDKSLMADRETGGTLEELDLSNTTFCVETVNDTEHSLSICINYVTSTEKTQRITPGYASESTTDLPSDVFGYTQLKRVILNDRTTRILQSAFRGCSKLEYVEFPSQLTSIAQFAFWPSKMEEVDLTMCSSLTSIGDRAFLAELTPGAYPVNVYFPASEITFGSNVFAMSNSGYQTRSDIDLYFPMSVMDYSRAQAQLADYCKPSNMRFAPMLEKGNWVRTFSFDRDLDYTTIAGRRNDKTTGSTETLHAYRATSYNKTDKTVTLTASNLRRANAEGVVVKGEGVANEFYPIPPSDGSTDGGTNYMKGSANTTVPLSTHPTATSTVFILKTDGDFYYCTGGTLAKYKAYLQTPEKILVVTDPGYFSNVNSLMVRWDDTPTGIESPIDNGELRMDNYDYSIYTLDGRKVATGELPKGIYIINGRKEVVK